MRSTKVFENDGESCVVCVCTCVYVCVGERKYRVYYVTIDTATAIHALHAVSAVGECRERTVVLVILVFKTGSSPILRNRYHIHVLRSFCFLCHHNFYMVICYFCILSVS